MDVTDRTSLAAQRRARQLAFVQGGGQLRLGSLEGLPWRAADLQGLRGDEPWVVQRYDGGLTAEVYVLHDGARRWTLKRARRPARVHNVDGQTLFLNEVQRRMDLERLKRQPGGPERWRAIVDTRYASFREGLILSPWIDGEPVAQWGPRQIGQLLEAACQLWCEGLFEWDYSPGNMLDDGRQVWLFDFGYLYAFDPRRQFNTAGRGDDQPMFHPAERFETRAFSAWLLQVQARDGEAAALAAFPLEKEIALDAYGRMRATIASRGACAQVLDWLDGVQARWRQALRGGDSQALFLAESWGSHLLDVDDDLSGQSCTPLTLQRLAWLCEAVERRHADLRAAGALFWGDEHKSRARLAQELAERHAQALAYQL